jgi:hypothetical protein
MQAGIDEGMKREKSLVNAETEGRGTPPSAWNLSLFGTNDYV